MKPSTVGRFTSWGSWKLPILSKRATQKPHADMYIYDAHQYADTCQWCMHTPLAVQHNVWRHVYNTPTGHSRCLVFDRILWNFSRISERQNQSAVNAFKYVSSRPPTATHHKWNAIIGIGICKNNKSISTGGYILIWKQEKKSNNLKQKSDPQNLI